MQWFWDDIRVESRMATAADCEQEKAGKKALRLEQTAAGAWVKRRVGSLCRLLGRGQSFTSPSASGGGYNDMDCLLAFVGREICNDL